MNAAAITPTPAGNDAHARSVSRRFLAWSLATALIGVLSYCAADQKPMLALLSIAVGCASAWMTLGPATGRSRALPRWAVNLLVLAATVNAGFSLMSRTNPLVSNLSDFLALVLLIKLLDRRRPRDEAQMLGLSMFVVIGSVLTSNSFLLGLVLTVYTPLVIAAVVWFQVFAGRQSLANAHPETPPATDGWGPAGRRSLVVLTTFTLVAVVALGLIAFVVTPRTIASQALGGWGQAYAPPQTDFRPDIELGSAGSLSASEDAVMDISVADADGSPLAVPPALIYLRGSVLNDYDAQHGRWSSRRRRDNARRFVFKEELPANESRVLRGGEPAPVAGLVRYTINVHRQPAGSWPLFSPWRPVSISFPSVARIGYTTDFAVERTEGPSGRLTYTVAAAPDSGTLPADGGRAEPVAAGPEVTPRIRELAASILREADLAPIRDDRPPGSERLVAQALTAYLRSRYTYTLDMVAPADGQDPIEMFLFDTQRGHCEYFAAALTALLRAGGIQARVVTGYAAGEFNSIVGAFVVRKADAHAWVEARVSDDPVRWEVFDATPPSQLAHSQRAAGEGVLAQLVARFRQAYEAAELRWIQSVVTFEQSPSSTYDLFAAGDGARRRARQFSGRLEALAENFIGDPASPGARQARWARWIGLVLLAATALVGLLAALTYLARRITRTAGVHLWPRSARQGAPARRRAQVPAFYRELVAALDRAGHVRNRGVHPLAHARAAAPLLGPVADDVEWLIRLAYRARFGGQPLSPAESRAAAQRVRALHRTLGKAR